MEDLFDTLEKYCAGESYPMHMPGHKRNTGLVSGPEPYGVDITEIDGFDNLSEAEGLLREKMEQAAECFHADRTFYLVNGSSGGILTGIFAATRQGDTVLVARNCHKSVYHAMELRELTPVYLQPEVCPGTGICKGIRAAAVAQALQEHPEVTLVLLTSPTYEGMLSEVAEIAELAHAHGIPLMVDEAHGAHLGFHPFFGKNSNEHSADLVVQSVHKTLPSLTQTALLHVNGSRVKVGRVERFWKMFQTSSPSYLLMASIDRCVRLLKEQGEELFSRHAARLERFYRETEALTRLKRLPMEVPGEPRDAAKLVISTENISMTGPELYDILRSDYGIQPEMAAGQYVICMTTIADTPEGFWRLTEALLAVDADAVPVQKKALPPLAEQTFSGSPQLFAKLPKRRLPAVTARDCPQEWVPWEAAAGRIVGEYIFLYPPGIPLLVPGEVLGAREQELLRQYEQQGLQVHGLTQEKQLAVIRKE